MSTPVVLMFSGQGSQYYRMGLELYRQHPRFRLWMDHCDEIARPLIGTSLCEVLYQEGDRGQPFDRLLYSNPALVAFEFSLARVLMEAGVRPDCLLGYSLGEISAAVVGGAITLEDALGFVVAYAQLLEAESPPASMLAVLDAPALETRYAELFDGCSVSARNFDRHLVVCGAATAIARLREALVRDGVAHQLLAVNYGFHTALMQPLQAKVLALGRRIDFRPLRIPVVSSLDGRRFEAGQPIDDWPEHLWAMSREPVAFDATLRSLLPRGDQRFVDVGPSGTLATFVKYLLPPSSGSEFLEVITPFGRDQASLAGALQRLGARDACHA